MYLFAGYWLHRVSVKKLKQSDGYQMSFCLNSSPYDLMIKKQSNRLIPTDIYHGFDTKCPFCKKSSQGIACSFLKTYLQDIYLAVKVHEAIRIEWLVIEGIHQKDR